MKNSRVVGYAFCAMDEQQKLKSMVFNAIEWTIKLLVRLSGKYHGFLI